ncbi:dihydrolipoamide acetyltransferase family protein [Nocardia higoensis]|uniref:dihydrolipoamide acetyltransferase family protein n=1 Tax=Nocardia higoensis TaxID=228599 RepID=UPI0003089C7D|nr:dihydrolipoamide acetyltransferase family protein [Nocardia higoensis]
MSSQFLMPSLGADMTQGTLLRWLVQPGDHVQPGDIVAEVDTTKAAIDVECFDEGTIAEILVEEGTTVPVGTPLATIDFVSEHAQVRPAPPAATQERPPAPVDTHPARATPLIRRMAEEAGLELSALHGSGPGGRIMRSDVTAAAATRTSPAAPRAVAPSRPVVHASGYARRLAAESGLDLGSIPGSGRNGEVRARDVIAARSLSVDGTGSRAEPADERERNAEAARRLIAAGMSRSKRTIPHYYLSSTIDMDDAAATMRELNRVRPVAERIVPAAFLLCAAARAARAVPALNGHWIEDSFRPATAVHLGVVVSLRGGGIMVPTVPDADTLTVAAMMGALREVVARTRSQRLRSRDTVAATVTVTNLGDLGVDSVFGVIPVPQVAIVGFGAVAVRPCVVDGIVTARTQVTATLAADHRATDGAIGARYLNVMSDILRHLEE